MSRYGLEATGNAGEKQMIYRQVGRLTAGIMSRPGQRPIDSTQN